ncbi:hypothetical protein [Anaeromassilibacillus sp. SJQ-1]|uniref:hypothetical protein n=1 Tax=Anaeromassilibacillus sp. SJQ-1 TaxID=3375419 RepID=UPI00398A0B29
MILLNEDWTFTATDADCDIGYAGENGVRTLYIRMNGLEYEGWSFFLDVQRKEQKDIWAVEPEPFNGDLLLRVPIQQAYLVDDGAVYVQLRRRPGWAGQKIGSTAASRPMQHRPGGGGSLAASLGVCRV